MSIGSDDSLVCYWDINASGGSSAKGAGLKPLMVFSGHAEGVDDVAWSLQESTFASCGEDKLLMLWDTRDKDRTKAKTVMKGHTAEVFSISWNPFNEYLLASGSGDKTVGFWDVRKPTEMLHSLQSHVNQVSKVEWSPFNEVCLIYAIFAWRSSFFFLSSFSFSILSFDGIVDVDNSLICVFF